jgi:thiamine-monophosphate kinase
VKRGETSSLPGEFELIASYFAPLAKGFPGAFGLLDDAALIAAPRGQELVVKTDAIVGGVHFFADDPPALIARKALRVNLSDLAAKGAVPRAYLLDVMLPASTSEGWIAAFAAGLARDQREFGVHLIGGDTDSTPGPVTIAVTAIGAIASGQMIRRRGARHDDTVFVTGTIGDAALGLQVLQGVLANLGKNAAKFLVDRFRLPRPRTLLGPRLIGLATAAIDVSDGLVADLEHICEVSGLSAVIEARSVPLSAAARSALAKNPGRIATALTGGDDYEILFTAPSAAVNAVSELSRSLGIRISAIGRMHPPVAKQGARITVLDEVGQPVSLDHSGWKHF